MRRVVGEAIVLAGGYGTRLAHLVPDVCKPMAPVAGRPFLRYVLDRLAAQGVRRVVIADGYKREQIEGYFGVAYRGMEVVYSSEDSPLLTGGAAKQALLSCNDDWVLVTNGDTYVEVDLAAMYAAANAAPPGVRAVMAVRRMEDTSRYGTVEVDGGMLVRAFREKEGCASGLVNAGCYLLRRDALADMPPTFSLERDWLELLANTGLLVAVEVDGAFIDIGVPADYSRAQVMMAPFVHGWKLAIFDRDGTLNVDTGHTHRLEELELVPEGVEELQRFSEDSAYKIVVVTNQAGIARGLYSEIQMRAFNEALARRLERAGCRVDAFYYCPHHPDFSGPCGCRKPAPGMLLAAMRDFDVKPEDCVMHGDSDADRLAAEAAGVRFVRIGLHAQESGGRGEK